jgi:hypothetical protein
LIRIKKEKTLDLLVVRLPIVGSLPYQADIPDVEDVEDEDEDEDGALIEDTSDMDDDIAGVVINTDTSDESG